MTVAPAEQPTVLSQLERSRDLSRPSVKPKAIPLWSEYQQGQGAVQKAGRLLPSSSRSSQIADDVHRLDLAIEAWRGFDRATNRTSIDVVDEWRGAGDCKRGSADDETSLAASVDAAFTAL